MIISKKIKIGLWVGIIVIGVALVTTLITAVMKRGSSSDSINIFGIFNQKDQVRDFSLQSNEELKRASSYFKAKYPIPEGNEKKIPSNGFITFKIPKIPELDSYITRHPTPTKEMGFYLTDLRIFIIDQDNKIYETFLNEIELLTSKNYYYCSRGLLTNPDDRILHNFTKGLFLDSNGHPFYPQIQKVSKAYIRVGNRILYEFAEQKESEKFIEE
jgi:hypothetical protein